MNDRIPQPRCPIPLDELIEGLMMEYGPNEVLIKLTDWLYANKIGILSNVGIDFEKKVIMLENDKNLFFNRIGLLGANNDFIKFLSEITEGDNNTFIFKEEN